MNLEPPEHALEQAARSLERGRFRAYPGLPPVPSFDDHGSRYYAPDKPPDRIPLPVVRKAEDTVGRPLYCRYAWIDADESSCAYAVAGPLGFCWATGRLHGAVWEIETFVPSMIDPRGSRWVLETDRPHSHQGGGANPPDVRDVQPFDYLTRSFLDYFGLFPPAVQTVFQEPFRADPPQWVFSPWCTSTWEGPDGQLAFRYHQWAFATLNEKAIALAFGMKEIVRPAHATWRAVFDDVLQAPWRTARATWYAVPSQASVEQDAYTLLGVDPSATDEEIARAYKRLARYLHPDSPEFGTATGTPLKDFHALSAAYDAVKSEAARSAYVTTRTFSSSIPSSIGNVGWWVPPEEAEGDPPDSPASLAGVARG